MTSTSNVSLVTQGLAGAGAALLQLADLVLHFIRKWFFGRTPRQAFRVGFLMPSVCFHAFSSCATAVTD